MTDGKTNTFADLLLARRPPMRHGGTPRAELAHAIGRRFRLRSFTPAGGRVDGIRLQAMSTRSRPFDDKDDRMDELTLRLILTRTGAGFVRAPRTLSARGGARAAAAGPAD
jgi:hypothetical protein